MLSRQAVRLSSKARVPIRPFNNVVDGRTYSTNPSNPPGEPNRADQAGDPQHQAFGRGKYTHQNPQRTSSLDATAANSNSQQKAPHDGLSGNPEGVGFRDQVGSQSFSATRSSLSERHESVGGQENITPPSFVDAVKNKLGLKTTPGEDKQNRGGGEGVTGTGKPRFDSGKRTFMTSAVARFPADRTTEGTAPESSRMPKDSTIGDQNAHLKHKEGNERDHGKGNAASNPTLPSHKFSDKKPSQQQTRSFSTSTRASNDTKHTADSYFKDIDSNPPSSDKAHQVDGGNTGPKVHRATEPLTGGFDQKGVGSQEYETVDKKHPYDVPPSEGPEAEEKLRYGSKPNLNTEESQSRTSNPGEGPEGASAGGRKPEGR
ncbi:hypothetical protein K474DRAFT_1661924 [Panus rudis PR-1116 ss-1]|nr:hypothetical protein K474DRAFT_1661924 [Panus rudis PR-1116 ss-1]